MCCALRCAASTRPPPRLAFRECAGYSCPSCRKSLFSLRLLLGSGVRRVGTGVFNVQISVDTSVLTAVIWGARNMPPRWAGKRASVPQMLRAATVCDARRRQDSIRASYIVAETPSCHPPSTRTHARMSNAAPSVPCGNLPVCAPCFLSSLLDWG